MSTQPQSGLLTEAGAVPLEGVRIEAQLSGASAEVTVTQRYRNREQVPIEAVYVFPLDEAAAVCGFAARIGERLVSGKVCEREQAFAAYDDALHDGDTAFLLDQERPNVFTASVGNLHPGEEVELQIRYVALAAREGDAVRLAIPTTVSPRYVPQGKPEIGQPEAERVNPEHWARVPYGLSLRVDISGAQWKRLESPSHPIRTTLLEQGASVELSQEVAALDRDFVLLVEPREARKPVARVAREADGRRVLMLTFLPDLSAATETGHEVLFLLDCSGSMGGESITQAKRALALCVRALGSEDTFNIVCFGSEHRALWSEPRRFDDASLDEASRHIAQIEADLGGTEILTPLQALLQGPRAGVRQRRVLVLTDGQVSNEAEVIALSREHAGEARIFAFGIGAGASEHLVRGMARASRGAAEMIFPGERIEPKVLRTFARVRTPVLDDVRVDYAGLKVEQAPQRTPPVFAGDALSVFARIEAGSADHVELVAGEHRFRVDVDLEKAEAGGPIPTLWARECIRELDDPLGNARGSQQRRIEAEARQRARLVELGQRYGLLSSATSFVAIEERAQSERTTQPAQLRRIPVALTSGWGGGTAAASPVLAAMPMVRSAPMPASPAGPVTRGGFALRAQASASSAPPPASAERESRALPKRSRSLRARSEVEAPLSATPSELDRVFELLMTQRADGSFPRSPALEAWLGAERSAALVSACKLHGEALVATSVAIALLEREAPERESEWRPAVDKARAFCARQPAGFDARALVAKGSQPSTP